MQAKTVALKMRQHNINVIDFNEGDEWEDGDVQITELIHIQVPTYGRGLCVVHQVDDGNAYKFFPPRTSIKALIDDLRTAMGLIPA